MISLIKKHWIFSLIFFVACVAFAAKITENNLLIGKPGSSADKVIEFDVGDGANNPTIVVDNTDKDFDFNKAMNIAGDLLKVGDGTNTTKEVVFDIGAGSSNPRFRWNSSFNVLEFSTDGSSFKKIGSGSGGASGVNVLQDNNSDFETGTPPTDWTASGGTFISETSAPLFGGQSGSWDASALNQTLDSVLAPITSGFLGRTCQVAIEYKYASGTAGDYQLVARQYDDSLATEIDVAVIDLTVTGTTSQPATLFFTCPDDVADDLRVRIQAKVANPGIIVVDDAFAGTGRASQFGVPSNQIVTNFLTADVTINTTVGDLTFSGLEVGATYELTGLIHAVLDDGAANPDVVLTVNNGATTVALFGPSIQESVDSVSDALYLSVATKFVATDTTLTFVTSSFGAGSSLRGNNTKQETYMQLEKRNDLGAPSESITLETSGWHAEGYIAGANPTLSVVDVSSPSSVSNASLQIYPVGTSQPVKIGCDGGNSPTGVTCAAGSERVSVVPNLPTAGLYKVCFDFSQNTTMSSPNGGELRTTWSIRELSLDGTVGIRTGLNNKYRATQYTGSPTSDTRATPMTLCESFYFDSPGEKNLILAYSQDDTSGSTSSNTLIADGSGGVSGGRDIHFSITKESEQKPTPVFTDLQNALSTKVEGAGQELVAVSADISESCTINSESGDWIDTCTDRGVGAITLDFVPGLFTGLPNCTVTPASAGGNYSAIDITSDTQVGFESYNTAGTQTNVRNKIICVGNR